MREINAERILKEIELYVKNETLIQRQKMSEIVPLQFRTGRILAAQEIELKIEELKKGTNACWINDLIQLKNKEGTFVVASSLKEHLIYEDKGQFVEVHISEVEKKVGHVDYFK